MTLHAIFLAISQTRCAAVQELIQFACRNVVCVAGFGVRWLLKRKILQLPNSTEQPVRLDYIAISKLWHQGELSSRCDMCFFNRFSTNNVPRNFEWSLRTVSECWSEFSPVYSMAHNNWNQGKISCALKTAWSIPIQYTYRT